MGAMMNRAVRAGLITLAVAGAAGQARAQAGCTLRGSPLMPKGAALASAAQEGEVLGKFTGQPIGATAVLPATQGHRAAIKTSGFRIEGFVDPKELPAYSTKNLAVVPDHVWIGGSRRVQIVSSAASQATVELRVGAPIDQSVRATTACDGLSLDPTTLATPPIPGDARGYLAKKSPLELRKGPGGAVVFTLGSESVKDALLFWSTERRGGFVHVRLGGDLVIDGWLPLGDLQPLKEGEMMDALVPGTRQVLPAKLVLQGEPKKVKVIKDVVIRPHAEDKAPVIGAIEPGTEVLIIEGILGWSNVIPAALTLLPPDGQKGGFWVKTSELNAATEPPPK